MTGQRLPIGDRALCRSCNAAILWVETVNGRKMPLDPEPVADGNMVVEPDGRMRTVKKADANAIPFETPRYKSHFATCKFAASHRK